MNGETKYIQQQNFFNYQSHTTHRKHKIKFPKRDLTTLDSIRSCS